MRLSRAITAYLTGHPVGAVFAAPFDVRLVGPRCRRAGSPYISRERAAVLTDQHVRGAPDLVIEILSPGTRKTDEITKRKLYERYGVAEYWVVDPELEILKIHRSTEEGYARLAELAAESGDTLTTPLLPGFSVTLAAVFAPAL
jgi:Uma2 family endonuclease